MKASLYKSKFLNHIKALEKFNAWELIHFQDLTAKKALAYIGSLYQLIPFEARQRPPYPNGIIQMRKAFSKLKAKK